MRKKFDTSERLLSLLLLTCFCLAACFFSYGGALIFTIGSFY